MHSFTTSVAVWALPAIVIVTTLGALLMCLLVLRYGLTALSEAAEAPAPAVRTPGVLAVRLGHAAAGACFAAAAMLAVVVLVQQPRGSEARVAARDAAASAQWRAELDRLQEELRGLEARVAHAETLAGSADSRAAAAQSRADAGETRITAVTARVVGIDSRVKGVESSARQAAGDAARALASARQLERTIAARRATPLQAPRPAEARPAPTRPATPAPSPSTEAPPRPAPQPAPDVKTPAPDVKAPAPDGNAVQTAPPPRVNPTPRGVGGQTAIASPTDKIGARMQQDWEAIKRDARTTGRELNNALRRLRKWVSAQ